MGQSDVTEEGLNLPRMALQVKEGVHEPMNASSLEKFGKTGTWSLPRACRKECSLDTWVSAQGDCFRFPSRRTAR